MGVKFLCASNILPGEACSVSATPPFLRHHSRDDRTRITARRRNGDKMPASRNLTSHNSVTAGEKTAVKATQTVFTVVLSPEDSLSGPPMHIREDSEIGGHHLPVDHLPCAMLAGSNEAQARQYTTASCIGDALHPTKPMQ